MKKLILWILIISVAMFIVNSDKSDIVEAVSGKRDDNTTYLLCGYDESGDNTDVIVLAHYNEAANSLSFVHIPRDTYYKGPSISKINAIFPDAVADGKSNVEALNTLRKAISNALGIRIDASIGCTMQNFVRLVNAIGGVNLNLPSSLIIKNESGADLLLAEGHNHLDGKDALSFVRARNGYTTGDIGRIDAQKLFLSAFIGRLKNDVGLTDIVKACISTGNGWTIDGKISNLFKMLAKNKGRIANISTKYANIPGLQTKNSAGEWYYTVSKYAADEFLNHLGVYRYGDVDEGGLLINESEPEFVKIYNTRDVKIKIYDDASLAEIRLEVRK